MFPTGKATRKTLTAETVPHSFASSGMVMLICSKLESEFDLLHFSKLFAVNSRPLNGPSMSKFVCMPFASQSIFTINDRKSKVSLFRRPSSSR